MAAIDHGPRPRPIARLLLLLNYAACYRLLIVTLLCLRFHIGMTVSALRSSLAFMACSFRGWHAFENCRLGVKCIVDTCVHGPERRSSQLIRLAGSLSTCHLCAVTHFISQADSCHCQCWKLAPAREEASALNIIFLGEAIELQTLSASPGHRRQATSIGLIEKIK